MPSLAASLTVLGLAVQMAVAAPWNAEGTQVDALEARSRWNKERCYTYFKNCGTQVKNVNSNKLIDASDLTIDLNILDLNDGRRYRRHRVPQHCVRYVKSYNSGTQVTNVNENKLIDLSNLDLFADILSRDVSEEPVAARDVYRNSGTQVTNVNENKAVDASNIDVDVDALTDDLYERDIYRNSGTQVTNDNQNKLVDASGLDVFANVLSRRDYGDQECFCRPRQQANCGNGWTPPRIHTPNVPNRPHTTHRAWTATPTWRQHRPTGRPSRPTCRSGYTHVNNGVQVMNKNENKLIDLSNLDLDIDILSDNDASERRTVKGTYTCNGSRGCCVEKAPSCSNGYTYVNSGTEIYNDNENKALDLSNLDLDLNILSLGGASESRREKANWKCSGSRGCCVKHPSRHGSCKSGFKWVNKGVSVTNINENKLLDLSNANLCIALLSGDSCEDKKSAKSNWSCQRDEGCCVKSVNTGTQVTNKNENKGIDLSNLDLGLNVLSGDKDGKGVLGSGKGGLLGTGLLG